MNGAPLTSLPLTSLPLTSLLLADLPLTSLPLTSLGVDVCAELGEALSDLTCTEIGALTVYEASLRGAPLTSLGLDGLPLTSLDLATLPVEYAPLTSLPLTSLPLTSLPLTSLPLTSLDLTGTPLTSLPLTSLDVGSIPLTSLDLVGSPLTSLPLTSLPLTSLGLDSIPLTSLPLTSLPLTSLDLQQLVVNGLPLTSLPLTSLDLLDSPLTSLPLTSLPLTSLDLIDCTLVNCEVDSLGDAFRAGAIDPTLTLGAIQSALSGIRLGELLDAFTDFGAEELEAALAAAGLTFGDLIGVDDMTLGDLPLDDPIVGALTLAQLESALWIVTYSDLFGIIIDPATGEPFDAAVVEAALLAALVAQNATVADLEYFGELTLGDLLANSTDPAIQGLTIEAIGSFLGFVTVADMISVVGVDETALLNDIAIIPLTLADLSDEELSLLTLGDLVDNFGSTLVGDWLTELAEFGALDGFVLADLLAALVGLEDVAFSAVDFTEVESGSLPDGTVPDVTFRAGFTVTDTPNTQAVTVTVELPATATYVPGTGLLDDFVTQTPLEPQINGNTATWEVFGVTPDTQYLITFDVRPEVSLGSTSLSGTGRVNGTDAIVFGDASVTVNEGLEPNDTIADATTILPETVYLTYIRSITDLDVFRIDVDERDRLAIQLSNLTADLDVVVYGADIGGVAGSALTDVSDEAPLDPIVDVDGTETVTEIGDDVPRLDLDDPNLALIAYSSASEFADEVIVTEPLEAGTYYIQVHGANGARNQDPATLQVQILDAEARPACSTLAEILAAEGNPLDPSVSTGAIPTSDTAANTVFLVNEQRLEQLYGATGRADVMNSLEALVLYLENNPGLDLDPIVVPVDAYLGVQLAYDAWDNGDGVDACDPDAANAVVGEIIEVIEDLRLTNDIDHLIVVGGDDVIPMARLDDATIVANEYDYRTEFTGDLNGADPFEVSPFTATFWESQYLSDDPYAESSARSLGERFLYVPDYSLGRLVETPTEIASALDTYVRFDGELDVSTATVLGYDFLVDATEDITETLEGALGAVNVDSDFADGFVGAPPADLTDLTTAWDREDATAKLVPPDGSDAADIISFNGHFDHYRALPAAGDKVPNFNDNVETSALLAAIPNDILEGTILFSAGCHSGLSVSDIQIGNTNYDWAQASSQNDTLYVGNTGFGYGDTETIAYTERLLTIFTEEMVSPLQLPNLSSPTTIGEAFSTAKNRFVAETTVLSVYDEKAVQEAVFYGLPIYRVGLAAEPAPPVPANTTTPDGTGTESLLVPIDADNDRQETDSGVLYSNVGSEGADDVISVPGRPVQPKTSTDVSVVDPANPTELSLIARGGLVIDMTSTYVSEPDPVVASVVVDESGQVPEPDIPSGAFPTRPIQITETNTTVGQRQVLSIATGQYKPGPALQRLDDDIDVIVYYADPGETDVNRPRIRTIDSSVGDVDVASGTKQLTVTATVADDTGVDRVVVLVAEDPEAGATIDWTTAELQDQGDGTWVGSAPLDGDTEGIELIVQAKDAAGNVAYVTDKAGTFVDAEPEPEPVAPAPVDLVVTADQSGFDAAAGWYTGPVTVTVVAEGGVAGFSLNGAEFEPVVDGEILVGENRVNQLVVRTPQDEEIELEIKIDAPGAVSSGSTVGAPEVVLAVPVEGGTYEPGSFIYQFACSDPSLDGCVPKLDGAIVGDSDLLPQTPGVYVFTVEAVDAFGNQTTASANFEIVEPLAVTFDDTGFDPVAGWFDGPVAFTATAGLPITYQLDSGPVLSLTSGDGFVVTDSGITDVRVVAGDSTFFTQVRIDNDGGPDITAQVPVQGQVFPFGHSATYQWLCDDISPFTCTGTLNGQTVSLNQPLPALGGEYTLELNGSDLLGNPSAVTIDFSVEQALDVVIDPTNLSPTGSGWYTGPVEVVVNGGGLGLIEYSVDGGATFLPILTNPGSFVVLADGATEIVVRDGEGGSFTDVIEIDTDGPPQITISTPVDGELYDPAVGGFFDFDCIDVSPTTCEGVLGDGAVVLDGDPLPTIADSYTLEVTAVDSVGGTSTETVAFLVAEPLAVDVDDTNLAGNGSGFYIGDVVVTVTGGTALSYTLDGIGPIPILSGESFTITGEGISSFAVESDAGERIADSVEIDSLTPIFTEISPTALTQYPAGSDDTYDWLCQDANLASCEGTVNGTPVSIGGAFPSAPGGYTLTVTGVDEAGNTTVSNVYFEIVVVGVSEPEIVTINGPAVPVGDAVVLDIEFGDDDGSADAYTIDVDWGDSDDDDPSTMATTCTASTGAPTAGNPACEIVSAPTAPGETDGLMTASFTYPEPGVYTVTVTIADAAGNTDISVFEFAVVYDPTINGRVAGAGWYWSGAEAYAEEEPWGGPAFFGYRARYNNDEAVRGKTRLHLLGEFFFKSQSYDYLIINDTMAIAEGVGKINGDTGYRFRVQGIDNGRFDFFQISIWDEVTGEVIYDNGILYDEGDLVLLGGIRVRE
ncbi:MAG: hypothetical protein AAF081_06360 [Actinomycetota bacterium]